VADNKDGGLFLFDSLRDPRRKNETKLQGEFLSGTFTDFKNQQKMLSISAKQGLSTTSTGFNRAGKLQNFRQDVVKNFDKHTGLNSNKVFDQDKKRMQNSMLKKF
jgi:hypothetical protein